MSVPPGSACEIVCGREGGDTTLSHDAGICVAAPPHVWFATVPVAFWVTTNGRLTIGSLPPPFLECLNAWCELQVEDI